MRWPRNWKPPSAERISSLHRRIKAPICIYLIFLICDACNLIEYGRASHGGEDAADSQNGGKSP
jgi:hypothetical protein